MIVIRIEMWPLGDEKRKRLLGIARISNDGLGTADTGNYKVELSKFGSETQIWKRGRVESFPRLKLGPWDLLFRALARTVGYRSKVDDEEAKRLEEQVTR